MRIPVQVVNYDNLKKSSGLAVLEYIKLFHIDYLKEWTILANTNNVNSIIAEAVNHNSNNDNPTLPLSWRKYESFERLTDSVLFVNYALLMTTTKF